MVFAATLNQYMSRVGCSVIRLAEMTGLSKSTISRYKTGVRLPEAGSDTLRVLSGALAVAASESACEDAGVSEAELYKELSAAYEAERSEFDYAKFSSRLDSIIRALGINVTTMSLYCSRDVSNLSRLRYGLRKPRDPHSLIAFLSSYIVSDYSGISDKRRVAELLCIEPAELSSAQMYEQLLTSWLSGEAIGSSPEAGNDLQWFDVDDFLRTRNIGKVSRRSGDDASVNLPSASTLAYTGKTGLETGTLAFIAATRCSRSPRDIVIHSELPIDGYSDEFIRGIASLCVKGTHIHVIHTVDRPFHELMRGLEAWLPLYMTGKVTPYYLDASASTPFRHLLLVSGSAALFGDAVVGLEERGEYRFSRDDKLIAGARARADRLLSYAKPLFTLYNKKDKVCFNEFLDNELCRASSVKSLLTAPPVFTLKDELLKKMLGRNGIDVAQGGAIVEYVASMKRRYALLLKNGSLCENIAIWSEEEFCAHPVALPIGAAFPESELFYTYDEYLSHIKDAEAFAASNPRYRLVLDRAPDFRGMTITVFGKSSAMIMKERSDGLQLVTKHPGLVEAFYRLASV